MNKTLLLTFLVTFPLITEYIMKHTIHLNLDIVENFQILVDGKNYSFAVETKLLKNHFTEYISYANYLAVLLFIFFMMLDEAIEKMIKYSNDKEKTVNADTYEKLKEPLNI